MRLLLLSKYFLYVHYNRLNYLVIKMWKYKYRYYVYFERIVYLIIFFIRMFQNLFSTNCISTCQYTFIRLYAVDCLFYSQKYECWRCCEIHLKWITKIFSQMTFLTIYIHLCLKDLFWNTVLLTHVCMLQKYYYYYYYVHVKIRYSINSLETFQIYETI